MAGLLLPARIYGVIVRLRYRSCLENRAAASLCGVPGGEAVPMPVGFGRLYQDPYVRVTVLHFRHPAVCRRPAQRYGDGLWNYLAVQIHPLPGDR